MRKVDSGEVSFSPPFGNLAVLIFITSAASGSMESPNPQSEIFGGGGDDVGIEHVQWFLMRTQPLFLKQYNSDLRSV